MPHHPAATAEMLDDLAPDEALYVLTLLGGRVRAEVFSYLEAELQDGIAQLMDRSMLATLVSAMSHDGAPTRLRAYPRSERNRSCRCWPRPSARTSAG